VVGDRLRRHAGAATLSTVDTTESESLARAAAHAAADKKATNIRILGVGELLGFTDFYVLVSAGNERQLGTVGEEIEYQVKTRFARGPRRREGTKETGWVVLDYGEVVVHAFTEEQRDYYDLERLWSDAPTLPVGEAAAVE
jgi:ribosome-associated protein